MSILADLGLYLQNANLGTLATNLFLAVMPDDPDTLTSLYEFAGEGTEDVFAQDLPAFEVRAIQLRTRGPGHEYNTARDRADTAWKELHKISNETVNGTLYLRVRKINGPFLIFVDEKDRPILSTNLQVVVVPS